MSYMVDSPTLVPCSIEVGPMFLKQTEHPEAPVAECIEDGMCSLDQQKFEAQSLNIISFATSIDISHEHHWDILGLRPMQFGRFGSAPASKSFATD